MIKSAIFDTKQVVMQRPLFISFLICVLVSANIVAQYTETINTNRPGTSQGAFSVGKNVIQFETGLLLGSENHSVFNNETKTTAFQYNIRVGLFKEQLEFGIEGSYLRLNSNDQIGNQNEFIRAGSPFNAIGVKYLVFDPYKYKREQGANILSWNANKKFKWSKLIPAVSAYAAANFVSTSSELGFPNNPDTRATEVQPNVTPRFVISAHNVWSERLVFIVNLVSNNLGSEFPEFRAIATTTYNFNSYLSVFGEYESIISQINNDHLLKAGGAFLLTKDLQFDARVLGNFKNTPSIFNVAFGASYRLDYHKNTDNDYIETPENYNIKKYVALIKKDIESGHLEESVLSGDLQSVSYEDVIVERFKGVNLESFAQQEEEEEEFDAEFDAEEEIEDTRIRWWQIGKKRRLRKKALSDTTGLDVSTVSGGRRTDFLDEDLFNQKQLEVTPAERTPEELAALELKNEQETNKKKKRFGKKDRANQVYVDGITGDSIPPPDYSTMTRKERKIAKQRHKELFELDELGLNDLQLDDFTESIEEEQNARDAEKERKKKEKKAKKLAKKNRKKANYSSENEVQEPIIENNEEATETLDSDNKSLQAEEKLNNKNAIKEEKELRKLEAKLAKEQAKERKRLAKEEAKRIKEQKSLEKKAKKKSKSKKEDEN